MTKIAIYKKIGKQLHIKMTKYVLRKKKNNPKHILIFRYKTVGALAYTKYKGTAYIDVGRNECV